MTITAHGKLNGHEIEAEVINPGDWFGKTWLVEIGGCAWPTFVAVEADSVTDAIDELSGNDKYGHNLVVEDADLADYPEDSRYCNDGGQVLDLDNILIHGEERPGHRNEYTPWACVYTGDDLPPEGMTPLAYYRKDDNDD